MRCYSSRRVEDMASACGRRCFSPGPPSRALGGATSATAIRRGSGSERMTGQIGGRSLAQPMEIIGGEREPNGPVGGSNGVGRAGSEMKSSRWSRLPESPQICIESRQPWLKPLKLETLNEMQSTTFLFSIRSVIFERTKYSASSPLLCEG